uniref:Ribosomal protein S6 kinase related n=1 Tax=Apteryx owenii TaxID=8824 RepID=A0A8B9PHI2_APTOW
GAAARLALPAGVPRAPLRPPAAAQDPGLCGQRLLWDHPQSAGLQAGEDLRREGGCCWRDRGRPPHAGHPPDGPSPPGGAQGGGAAPRHPQAVQGGSEHPVCTYCSTGDLHARWLAAGCFAEATVRLFAAELVLVLVYLHDLGIVHRDVKVGERCQRHWGCSRGVWGGGGSPRPPSPYRWRTSSWTSEVGARWCQVWGPPPPRGPPPQRRPCRPAGHLKLADFGLSRHLARGERARTICGTLHYMAPEVLSGGPYGHTADWWSLGVLLFALASGKFPVAPAPDHVAMLERVNRSSYESPGALSPELARLLAELLCRNPLRRLHYLHHFQGHPFFRGVAFDAELLQKDPVDVDVAPRPAEEPLPEAAVTFNDFDCDLAAPLDQPWPG